MKTDRNNIKSPAHDSIRSFLRIVGPLMIVTGVVFILLGLHGFFGNHKEGVKLTLPNGKITTVQADVSKLSSKRHEKIWCFFVGFPLLVLGVGATKFAYMGDIARYGAGELAPVGKDVVNYMADNTSEAVKTVSQSIASGISEGIKNHELESRQNTVNIRCHKCNGENKINAKFCNECGIELCKSKSCPECKELNDGDAKFCDECGYAF